MHYYRNVTTTTIIINIIIIIVIIIIIIIIIATANTITAIWDKKDVFPAIDGPNKIDQHPQYRKHNKSQGGYERPGVPNLWYVDGPLIKSSAAVEIAIW